jgi:hypothetical protein
MEKGVSLDERGERVQMSGIEHARGKCELRLKLLYIRGSSPQTRTSQTPYLATMQSNGKLCLPFHERVVLQALKG